MDTGVDPTKMKRTDKRAYRIRQMLDGMGKADPPTMKKLPVEADVPEFLVSVGQASSATERERALGDMALIAFYYLLRVGEYTKKGHRQGSKQTKPFQMKDVTFFKKDARGNLRQLPRTACDEDIMSADGATLKLDNQKNGWKGVCIFHFSNGDKISDPIRAIGRCYVHVRRHVLDPAAFAKTELSAFFLKGKRHDVTDKMVSAGLKLAATALDYPGRLGIPIERIDTHSLRCGGANALSLSGYSDTQIQKMGRWRGATFKEYIREQLACFSEGMSTAMKQTFQFVNVEGGVYSDVTSTIVTSPYDANVSAAAA